jgi:hypothetical protein
VAERADPVNTAAVPVIEGDVPLTKRAVLVAEGAVPVTEGDVFFSLYAFGKPAVHFS